MTDWTPTTTEPAKDGKYLALCGVTNDTFEAYWNETIKRWCNEAGSPIAFGERNCGDLWREDAAITRQAKTIN